MSGDYFMWNVLCLFFASMLAASDSPVIAICILFFIQF